MNDGESDVQYIVSNVKTFEIEATKNCFTINEEGEEKEVKFIYSEDEKKWSVYENGVFKLAGAVENDLFKIVSSDGKVLKSVILN